MRMGMGVELVGVYGRLFRACSGRFFAIGDCKRLSEGIVVRVARHGMRVGSTKGPVAPLLDQLGP